MVASEFARTSILKGETAIGRRRPEIGKTVGTVLGRSGSSFYRVMWEADEGGQFPIGALKPDHNRDTQYPFSELEWLMAPREMEKYVPTTTPTAEIEQYKQRVKEVAARAKRGHPGKAVDIDEILKNVGVTTGPPEPSKGSVVRHPTMSITYTRPWGFPTNGGNNWRCSDKYGSGPSELPWTEVVRLCGGSPVVLLDVKGDIDYTNADIRHNVQKVASA